MFLSRVVLVLLPVLGSVCGSYSQPAELIRRIHHEGDAKAVLFIGIEAELITTFMKVHSDVPVMTTEDGAGERINDVVILVAKAESEADKEILQRVITRLRVRKYVVISVKSKDLLHQMSAYFADQKFTRIFGSAQDVAYAFLPFAHKLVPLVSMEDPLPDAQRDLNGYPIRTTAQTDIPRVFRYPDTKGRLQIGGFYGQMFLSFVKAHNASFQEVAITKTLFIDSPAIWRGILDDRVELSMNCHAQLEKGYFVSYPVYMVGWTVMVPIHGYLNPDQYFLRPFTSPVWACIGGTFIYIVLMDVLKSLAEGHQPSPWRCFSQTLLMMLNMSADGLIGNSWRIHVLVVLYAFILVNFYLNHLTSYLTVFISIKQPETLQDLVDNGVHFLVPDYIWNHAAATGELPPSLETIAHTVDFSTFATQLNKMQNTSIGYALVRDKGEFLIGMQSLSGKPLFRLIPDYIGMVYTGFMMHPHSPFNEILTYFIMRCRESGVIDKWEWETVSQAMKSGFRVAKGESDENSVQPLSWNNLRFAWTSLAVGLALGLVAFAVETWSSFVNAIRARRAT